MNGAGGDVIFSSNTAANMKEGDWICPSCTNHNFASRTVCNRCGGPKPPPEGKGQPGDWVCPFCGNHNYRSRQACNRCGAPKPGAVKGGGCAGGGGNPYVMPMGPMGGKGGWGGSCLGMTGFQPQPPTGGGGGSQFRQGDWVCTSCGNHNYASREMCNKCGAPKPQVPIHGGFGKGVGAHFGPGCGGGFGGCGPTKGGGFAPRPGPYSPPMPPMMQGKPGSALRPGDWICTSCGNHNYASREVCNKCGADKPESAPANLQGTPPNFRPGDWMCPSCGNHNFASKTACNKCGEPKPE